MRSTPRSVRLRILFSTLCVAAGGTILAEQKGAEAAKLPEQLPLNVEVKGDRVFCIQDGAEMVFVPAGEFVMGDDDQSMNPRGNVRLAGFLIDKHEVTNAQYRKFVQETNHAPPSFEDPNRANVVLKTWDDAALSQPNQPVVGVSWEDAAAYCRWAGKELPSQAQWEKAARGTDGRKYPWGNAAAEEASVFKANFAQQVRPGAKGLKDGFAVSAPVGSFPSGSSPYGAMDMAGNVAEWCQDWGPPTGTRASVNPTGPANGAAKAIKGGSWTDNVLLYDFLRCSQVTYQKPHIRAKNLGFRGAISIAE